MRFLRVRTLRDRRPNADVRQEPNIMFMLDRTVQYPVKSLEIITDCMATTSEYKPNPYEPKTWRGVGHLKTVRSLSAWDRNKQCLV